jgi:hypothetical protein
MFLTVFLLRINLLFLPMTSPLSQCLKIEPLSSEVNCNSRANITVAALWGGRFLHIQPGCDGCSVREVV